MTMIMIKDYETNSDGISQHLKGYSYVQTSANIYSYIMTLSTQDPSVLKVVNRPLKEIACHLCLLISVYIGFPSCYVWKAEVFS